MKKLNKNYLEALKLAKRETTGDLDKVHDLLIEAYTEGSPHAAYALATWYLFGKHVERSYKKAVNYLEFAEAHDHPDAIYDLAVCYDLGKGVKRSKRSAFILYVRASLLGNKLAKLEVGRCYYYGFGTAKDKKIAQLWLK